MSTATFRPGDWAAPGRFIDPHPMLHELRGSAPVHFDPILEGWVLTRYDDILDALRDERLGEVEQIARIEALPPADQDALAPLRRIFTHWAGESNEIDHSTFVRVATPVLSPDRMEEFRPRMQQILDDLLRRLVPRGAFDVANDLARPFAGQVLAEVLGVPATRVDMLWRCAKSIIYGLFEIGTQDQLQECQERVLELRDFVTPVVAEHRTDGRRDLIGAFTDPNAGVDDEFVVAQCIMFLTVGYYPAAELLTNGLQLLLDHPAEKAKLHERPELIPNAVEEMMRFGGPPFSIRRVANTEMQVRDETICDGDSVILALNAANRDPDVFADPDTFDVARENLKRSLGFGTGKYHCTGRTLVRTEAAVFFGTLLERLPDLTALSPMPSWAPFLPFGRVLTALPVSLGQQT